MTMLKIMGCLLVLVVTSFTSAEFNESQKALFHEFQVKVQNFPHRHQIGQLLEKLGLKIGVELGVQRGEFSGYILGEWKSCEKYYLVDLWAPQANYLDSANVDQKAQDEIMNHAKNHLKAYADKTVFLRNYTTDAAKYFQNNSVDFVYVDARHDYCGALADIEAWWPKVRPGGVMSGHDYIDAGTEYYWSRKRKHEEHWEICGDGVTINQGAVKGAVDEFAKNNTLEVFSTKNDGPWVSWFYLPKGYDARKTSRAKRYLRSLKF